MLAAQTLKKKMIGSGLSSFINNQRKWCIIKISPTCSDLEIDNYYQMGFRQFHCCNTLPIKEGGLSGSSLIPYTTNKIIYIKKKVFRYRDYCRWRNTKL